jgi:hypothetical protein
LTYPNSFFSTFTAIRKKKRAPRCIAVCVGHTESVGAVVCSSHVARGRRAFVVSGSRDLTLKVRLSLCSRVPFRLVVSSTPTLLS